MKVEGRFSYVSADEMKEIDRAAAEEFGLGTDVLMENAGAAAAVVARGMLGGGAEGKAVCCLAGRGNNGGDGLVASRFLHNWGAEVLVVLAEGREKLHELPRKQAATLEKSGVKVVTECPNLSRFDLLVDALLGSGSVGDPRQPVSGLIDAVDSSGVPVLAVDVPSGLDSTTGEPGRPCVNAEATVTFGLMKLGFLNPNGAAVAGELWLADISLPKELCRRYGQEAAPFGRSSIVRVG